MAVAAAFGAGSYLIWIGVIWGVDALSARMKKDVDGGDTLREDALRALARP